MGPLSDAQLSIRPIFYFCYMTHVQDGLMTVSQAEFTRGFAAIQHAIATPRDKWLSTQIMNRTVWTNYKAYLAEQRRQAVRGNNDDINHMAICENCGQADEHTEHIFVTCPIAGIVWKELEDSLNYALRYVILDPDDSQRDHLPMKFSKSNIIYMKPTFSRNVQDTVNDILILGKRLISVQFSLFPFNGRVVQTRGQEYYHIN